MSRTKNIKKNVRKKRNTKKSSNSKSKRLQLRKKSTRRGGMVRQVLGPVRKGFTNVAEEYGKNILKDELFHKEGRLSNRTTKPFSSKNVVNLYSNDSSKNVPIYPTYIPKMSDLTYNDENQENINPNII
jgi:hypothetical protein